MSKKSTKRPAKKQVSPIGKLLDLSESDIALMEYKAEISSIAVKSIEASQMSVNEIVERSGVSRSKVSAVKNGATISISIDLLLRIIAATGTKIKIRAAYSSPIRKEKPTRNRAEKDLAMLFLK